MDQENKRDTINRFSNRVEYYIKYRPGYPVQMIEFLNEELSLSPSSIIADIGSGTGFLSELFLKNGNIVFGVEPGKEMREAAEERLEGYSNFKSINGTAEATGLESASADFVTAGQAFHWFDKKAARIEFQRILKPSGWILLVWNDRKSDGNAFLKDYESLLLKWSIDVSSSVNESAISQFFGADEYRLKMFDNFQQFDYEGLQGRLLSGSYTPIKGHPNYEPMIEELKRIFNTYNTNGEVRLEYDTRVYYGQIS